MATQKPSDKAESSKVSSTQQPNSGAQQSNQQVARSQQGRGLAEKSLMQAYFPSPSEFMANPFAAMRRMHEDMDRMFAQTFGSMGGGLMSGGSASSGGTGAGLTSWSPAIELKQQENQLVVCAELPGLRPEEVQVEVNEDALIIQGERRYEQTQNEGGIHRTERQYGRFYRAIPLPEGVNAAQAKAQFRDGMLEVTVPVPEQQSRRRRIPISGSSASSTLKNTEQGSGAAHASKSS